MCSYGTSKGSSSSSSSSSASIGTHPLSGCMYGGSEGDALVHIQVNFLPKRPVKAHATDGVIFIPKMFLGVGLRVSQSRLQFDRAANYTFVLAVEDCRSSISDSQNQSLIGCPIELGVRVSCPMVRRFCWILGDKLRFKMGGVGVSPAATLRQKRPSQDRPLPRIANSCASASMVSPLTPNFCTCRRHGSRRAKHGLARSASGAAAVPAPRPTRSS
jgi:hypothetical protein